MGVLSLRGGDKRVDMKEGKVVERGEKERKGKKKQE